MFHSVQQRWNDLAHPEKHDGQLIFRFAKPVFQLAIRVPGEDILLLSPPPDVPCFACARYRQGLSDPREGPEWMKTIFGYLLPEYAVLLHVEHLVTHMETLPRPFHFTW